MRRMHFGNRPRSSRLAPIGYRALRFPAHVSARTEFAESRTLPRHSLYLASRRMKLVQRRTRHTPGLKPCKQVQTGDGFSSLGPELESIARCCSKAKRADDKYVSCIRSLDAGKVGKTDTHNGTRPTALGFRRCVRCRECFSPGAVGRR